MDYLSREEIADIRISYRQLFESPEATSITIRFMTYASKGSVDQIYGNTTGTLDENEKVVEDVRSVIDYITPRHVRLLEFDFIEVGNAIFYFQENFNLEEPMPNVEVIDGSMFFIAPNDIEFVPDLEHIGDLSRTLGFWLSEYRIGSVVSCRIRRE